MVVTKFMAAFLILPIAIIMATSSNNMNGEYTIANPNPASGVVWNSEYQQEFFDVYTPNISTQYSECFWTMIGPVPLPDAIVKRFDEKVMAITGYEVDQVFTSPDGVDTSVPIYWAYNHHYEGYINGKYSEMVKGNVKGMPHGSGWIQRSIGTDPRPDSTIPSSQWFSEGNGGEMRKSFHGYPHGFAQLVDSPVSFSCQPMQIDTHNRDYNGTGFVPGPQPKASGAPPNAKYSGLLECPCTDRIVKDIQVNYQPQLVGTCKEAIFTEADCFIAGARMSVPGAVVKNATVSDATLPGPGCSVVAVGPGQFAVQYNSLRTGVACGGGAAAKTAGTQLDPATNVTLSVALDASTPAGVATITITGPSTVWYGVGFNTINMESLPYAIIVNGTSGVFEQKLAEHAPGQLLAPSVTLVSNNVNQGIRTVVLTRPFKGATADHYTFDPINAPNIPFINAIGSSLTFGYHAAKSTNTLAMVSVVSPTCICDFGATGTINGLGFGHNCPPQPMSDLAAFHNPTCDIRTYVGGLSCCHHQWFMLDKEQEIPAPVDTYRLKFRVWFDDYTPPTSNAPANYQNLVRFYWTTEYAAGEYDVVQCPAGTPSEECIYTITAHFTVNNMVDDCPTRGGSGCTGPKGNSTGINIMYAGGHCHAPSCLSLDLYNADTGQLICRQMPTYGTGTEIFNEEGYLALPPCLWGSAAEGLQEPIFLGFGTNLVSIKANNNTYYHYGEMASWQMRGVYV